VKNSVTKFAFPIVLYTLVIWVQSESIAAQQEPVLSIEHTAISYFKSHSPITINARLEDKHGILQVRCYFRYDSASDFLFVPMESTSRSQYQCKLPGSSGSSVRLEYLFLILNSRRQVVRTTPFISAVDDSLELPDWQGKDLPSAPIVYSELEAYPVAPEWYSLSGKVSIERVDNSIRYGLKSGLYIPPDEYNYVHGYFGGFIYHVEQGELLPIKGYVSFKPRSKHDAIESGKESEASFPSPENQSITSASTYPDINGDDWKGVFYITNSSNRTQISAEASHNNNGAMWLRTSKSGRGYYFTGSLSPNGDMYLIDTYDNEVWTTFYGPATATDIIIADYVTPTSRDLYIIDLSREIVSPEQPARDAAMIPIIEYLLH
jgi:hypothetical protein